MIFSNIVQVRVMIYRFLKYTILCNTSLEKTFYGLFPVLYYHSDLNDHFVFVVLICYWFCAALLIFTNA